MSVFGGIITNGLIAYFDANNPNSLKHNGQEFYVQSLVKYNKSITDNFVLDDYGLTAYDIGRANHLTATTFLTTGSNKLQLYPTNSNDQTGVTQTNLYPFFTSYTGSKMYLTLSGGSFQNFFKLEGYNWELLPYRYNNGLTLETWIKIDSTTSSVTQNNNGIFLYLGTRAENKFSTLYSGDSGYTTYSGLTLGPDHTDLEDGVYDNAISFVVNSELQLGYKYINSTGLTVENYSLNSLTSGWKHIAITFKPCDTYPDDFNGGICGDDKAATRFKSNWDDLVDCLDKREGQLSFYVNGRLFFKEECFPEEFWFKALNTEREKQIGVPFSITWGGGSFGLKNSYHYPSKYAEYTGDTIFAFEKDVIKDNLLIERNFDGSFFGGISTLRIYQKPLTVQEIRLNYNQEANSFGLNQFIGGRVIYTR
jgi:hypothetical protein